MGITFGATASIRSGLLAGGSTAIAATLFAGSGFGAIGWACVPVALIAGFVLARRLTHARGWRDIVRLAFAFGFTVALGGVVVYLAIAMGSALLPGSTVARPEGPIGYLVFAVISIVSLTPLVAIVTSAIGLAWATVVHASIEGR